MKLFKNRMILGITCIVISLIICFAITPLINVGLSKKTRVVRVNREIKAGEQLTKSMLTEVEVGNYNLPVNVYHSIDEVNGMYATADLVVGDYLFPAKLSEDAGKENTYLYHLNGEKQAISITIDKFARGLSGKLKSGDVVSVIAPDYLGSRETVIPQELQYVEVIAVTAKSGYDANLENGEDTEEKELPTTVTLLVRPEQAKILAQLEAERDIHLSSGRGSNTAGRKCDGRMGKPFIRKNNCQRKACPLSCEQEEKCYSSVVRYGFTADAMSWQSV